jgi:L-asparaginase II
MSDSLPVLVEVKRGPIVESRHRGAVVIVEPDGRLVAYVGDASLVTSTRSTIKPIQALPLITSGAADRFNLTSRELAVACASHEGEAIHTEAVSGILARIGLDETALRCCAHAPYNLDTAARLEREGLPFTQLHNNCSGKHAGMLATAVHLGLSTDDYVSPDHPVQREIVATLSRLADLPQSPPAGIDGCSAPTFGVALKSLALAFARLVNPWSARCSSGKAGPSDDQLLDAATADAAKRIVAAMQAHPEMIGGTKGRFDSDLLKAARGSLICKIGAEAAYVVGILPSAEYPRGLGIAVKIEDGSYRGLGPVVVETLSQLGVLNETQRSELRSYHLPVIKNRRGLEVGEIRAMFQLGSPPHH